jgi:hypothetical protein
MVDPAGDVEVVGCRHDRRTGSRQPALSGLTGATGFLKLVSFLRRNIAIRS